MKLQTVSSLAGELGLSMTEAQLCRFLTVPSHTEEISLVTYGYGLLERMNGIANGPAVLALWRGFAWTTEGSPKKSFKLRPDAILEAEQMLVIALRTLDFRGV